MKDNEILVHLQNSIKDAPINILEDIKKAKITKMTEHDEITRQELTASEISSGDVIDIEKAKELKDNRASNNKKTVLNRLSQKSIISFASVAALFIFVFIGFWQVRIPDSQIYLDINPSIQITTNKRDKVIKLNGLNDEAKKLIEDIKYKNKDYHDVTQEVIESLAIESIVSSKYIQDEKGVMLVSVYNHDTNKRKIQTEEIDNQIRKQLDSYDLHPILLTQSIDKSNTIERFSNEYGISAGKMTFIRNLILLKPELKTEDLVDLSLYELLEVSSNTGIDIDAIVNSGDDERVHTIPDIVTPSPSPEPTEKPTTKPTSKPTEKPTIKPPVETTQETQRRPISMEEAKSIALKKTYGGRIVNAEKDDDGFEFEIVNGNIEYEVELNMYGDLIYFDEDDYDDYEEYDDDEYDDDEYDD